MHKAEWIDLRYDATTPFPGITGDAITASLCVQSWAKMNMDAGLARDFEVVGALTANNFLPGIVYAQICRRCNLRCTMCGHAAWQRNTGLMPEAVWKRTLEETLNNHIRQLAFTGAQGEPLLHPHAGEFIWSALDAGLEVEINTNCTTLGERNIKMLTGAARSGRFTVQASFAGYDKASYEKTYVGADFELTSRKLTELYNAMAAAGVAGKLRVNGCILDGTHPDRHRGYLRSIGVDPALAMYREVDNFAGIVSCGRDLKPSARLRLCWVLVSNIIVYDDGKVSACACRDSEGVMEIGDIMQEGFLAMRNSPRFKAFIDAFMLRDVSGLPLCSKCDMPYENV